MPRKPKTQQPDMPTSPAPFKLGDVVVLKEGHTRPGTVLGLLHMKEFPSQWAAEVQWTVNAPPMLETTDKLQLLHREKLEGSDVAVSFSEDDWESVAAAAEYLEQSPRDFIELAAVAKARDLDDEIQEARGRE